MKFRKFNLVYMIQFAEFSILVSNNLSSMLWSYPDLFLILKFRHIFCDFPFWYQIAILLFISFVHFIIY